MKYLKKTYAFITKTFEEYDINFVLIFIYKLMIEIQFFYYIKSIEGQRICKVFFWGGGY